MTPFLSAQTNNLSGNPKAQKAFDEGRQYEIAHQYPLAISAYKKANKIAGGGCAPCLMHLTDLYRKTDDNKKSAEVAVQLEQVVTTPQEKAAAATFQGAALLREATEHKKRALFAQADAQFQHALQLEPNAASPQFLDGFALGNLGDDAGAHIAFSKYVANKQADPTMQARARRYLEKPSLVLEKMAPAFSVRTLQGNVVSLDSLQGKVVLLDFWATWCGPCNAELPHVQKIAKRFEGKPFVVLSVSSDKDAQKWQEFVQQHNMVWPQYRDKDGILGAIFNVQAIPHYYIIDSDGVLRQANFDTDIDGRLNQLVAQAQKLDEHAPVKMAASQSQ